LRTSYVEKVNRAIDSILSHLDEPLRLKALSRTAGLSPFHFHRVFQALVGETPADFVKRVRLDKALWLMAFTPKQSLTSIAMASGFTSSSDFSRCFKQRFGVPPSVFDIKAWRAQGAAKLESLTGPFTPSERIARLPARDNPDAFRVEIRRLPARSVAYIRVANPYQGKGVVDAVHRLVAWAERHGLADGQWLGYQWENPEITPLEDCGYYVAVVAEQFTPEGEVGRYEFPPMTVAQITMRGGIDLELRALQWLYGSWLARSRYVPEDQPCFEVWHGRPFAHGFTHFELDIHLPVRR
jgi:AraC family transcriptional regulator